MSIETGGPRLDDGSITGRQAKVGLIRLAGHVARAACMSVLCFAATVPRASAVEPGRAGEVSPIPVQFIFPPPKPQGTADDALATGRVVNGHYALTTPASKPWRIAFLFPHLKDPYWIGCGHGVISEARRLGVAVDILAADGYNDLVGQLRKMDESIAARYDAIVISPISLTANNAAIARARRQGVPVFELANDSTSDSLTVKVTTSLKAMGRSAMEWVIQDARKRGLKAINVALLPGPEGAGWVSGEVAGSHEAARRASIKVNILDTLYGDSDLVGQTQLAAQLLARHGQKLDYILGCTGCAPAAILPVREAGLSGKVRIVAYDLTRNIAESIRKGEIAAAADTKGVSQARVATNAVVSYLEGRGGKLPHTILIKLGLVDRSNAAGYPFGASIAPDGYVPVLSYRPGTAP